MKTLKELEEIRKKTLDTINIRKDRTGTRVVVGMATCGIAAGADVAVAQTGCIGMCRLEPMVEVYKPGEEKVTYVRVTAAKALRIINEHVMQGKVVDEYTIGAEDK
jgi:NADP-reducing hydrogenase subunit HndB